MKTSAAGQSFESFNARFLRFDEVGETFVHSPFMDDIVSPSHAAILGPRGSGKTTLLKMLTLPALQRWKDPARDALANSLEYLSVYIPSSLTWNADYRAFSGRKMPDDLSELISVSLFRHSVLLSLLNTWEDASREEINDSAELSRFYLPIAASEEAQHVRSLASNWDLKLPISTLGGLRSAISTRLRSLQALAVKAGYVGGTVEQFLEDAPYLASHFLDDCASFLDFLTETYGFRRKIALCFDEVEIAPDAIANAILKMPRSVDQRFLIKFSAAPYVGVAGSLRQPTDPTQRQDYKFVLLSSFSAKETRTFSELLFSSLARKHGVYRDSNEVLGTSLIDDAYGSAFSDSPRYKPRGTYQRRFKSLYQKDKTFQQYADQKGINVNDLSAGNENERAALIRKIIWPVLIRDEILLDPAAVAGNSTRPRRIRTAHPISDIYTGGASLFAICEGNPRQIIGLMEPILRTYVSNMQVAPEGPVRRSLQKQLIQRMVSAYFALVSSVPAGHQIGKERSLVDVVSRVGGYFKSTVTNRDFDPDPVLSFSIDPALPPQIIELVGRGINIGAFVVEDVSRPDAPYKLGDIVGLKARLSNLFAAHFRLPLAGGRTINLSTILRREDFGTQPLLELFGAKI